MPHARVLSLPIGPVPTGTRNGDDAGTMSIPTNAWLTHVSVFPFTKTTAPGMAFPTPEEQRPMRVVVVAGTSAAESPAIASGWIRGGGHGPSGTNENIHWSHGIRWTGRLWTGNTQYIVLASFQNDTGVDGTVQLQVIVEIP